MSHDNEVGWPLMPRGMVLKTLPRTVEQAFNEGVEWGLAWGAAFAALGEWARRCGTPLPCTICHAPNAEFAFRSSGPLCYGCLRDRERWHGTEADVQCTANDGRALVCHLYEGHGGKHLDIGAQRAWSERGEP